MNLGYFEVGLNVADFERSVTFYKSLGFELINGGPDIQTVTLKRGACRIALYHGYGEEPFYMQFYQGEVEKIAERCRSNGISPQAREAPFQETEQGSGVYSKLGRRDLGIALTALDPSGHLLHFIWQMHMPESPSPKALSWYLGLDAPKHAYLFDCFEASLPSQNVVKSIEFYEKLGFEVVRRDSEDSVQLRSDDCHLGIFGGLLEHERPKLKFFTAEPIVDVDAKEDGKSDSMTLLDPDGHALIFCSSSDQA